jgi:hypothetical protein
MMLNDQMKIQRDRSRTLFHLPTEAIPIAGKAAERLKLREVLSHQGKYTLLNPISLVEHAETFANLLPRPIESIQH